MRVIPLINGMGSYSSSLQIFDQVRIGGTVVRKDPFKDTFALKVSDTEVVCLDSLNLCTLVHISDFLSSRFYALDAAKTRRVNEIMVERGTNFGVSKQRAENARRKQVRMSSEESFVLHCHIKNSFANRRTQNPFSLKDKPGSWTVFIFPPNEGPKAS